MHQAPASTRGRRLRSRAAGGAAAVALSLAGVTIAASASCELTEPTDQFFDPNGVTQLVSYPSSSAPPGLLTLAGGFLFYAQGSTLYRIPTSGSPLPEAVPITLAGAPTEIAFDGAHTVAVCAGGSIVGFDPVTLVQAGFPALPRDCLHLAISTERLAYTTANDGGAASVVVWDLPDGSTDVQDLPESGTDPSQMGVALAGQDVYFAWDVGIARLGFFTKEKHDPCRTVLLGSPLHPKFVVFDGGEADGDPVYSMVLRGGGDSLRRINVNPAEEVHCCTLGSHANCGASSLEEFAPGGLGDFTVSGNLFYWSANGEIHRMPTGEVEAGLLPPPGEIVALRGGSAAGAPIPSIAVDDSYVYFTFATGVYRAPLPQTD